MMAGLMTGFMATLVATVATLVVALPVQARESFNWAHTLTNGQVQQVTTVAQSRSGDVFVGGYFQGQIDFDPGVGEAILISGANEAGFIAKYGLSGNLIWARAISGDDGVRINDLAVDVVNQIAVVGSFRGEVDLDPGPGVFNAVSEGSSDIFVLRLQIDGTLDWAFTAGNNGSDEAVSVAVDERYNLYVAGNFEGIVDFDPPPSKITLESRGKDDAFVTQFTNYGRVLWAKRFGGSQDDGASSIALDGANQIYLAGTFEGEADLDPDYTDFEAKSQGGSDIFVVILKVGGRLLAATHFGGPEDDGAPRLLVEPDGTHYVAGEFKATVDFNREQAGGVAISRGESDLFLLRYGPIQRFDWVFGLGSARSEMMGNLAKDTLGHIYLLGTFEESVDFDPGDGVTLLTSVGDDDIFVGRYTPTGALRDVRHLAGASDNRAADIAIDNNSQVVLVGNFQGTMDFGNGLTATGSGVPGRDDGFVARLPVEFWTPNYANLFLPNVQQSDLAQ
jgi:hypothetical protein